MINKKDIEALSEEFLKNSDDYLVEVDILSGNSIIVEIDNDQGVNIERCADLSHFIESNLDRETEDFELTVTSSGLTSPFKNIRQYKKYEGKEIEVLTRKGEKIYGILRSSNSEGFTVEVTKKVKTPENKRKVEVQESLTYAYTDVKYTKYQIRF